MRRPAVLVIAVAVGFASGAAALAQNQAAAATGRTDVYHVHFTKAVPGQAAALGKALMTPDTTSPMPDHFVVLRHQEGDSWDYAVIQHLGPKVTFDATTTPANPGRDLRAWHNDTFVSGPSWAEFTKAMGLGANAPAGMVYIVGVHRAVAGQRDQLEKALSAPAQGSVQTGNVLMQHLEGGDWLFLTITRYNSWQDLGADRAAAASGTAAGGWAEIRQYSDFHRDTIADRIFPGK